MISLRVSIFQAQSWSLHVLCALGVYAIASTVASAAPGVEGFDIVSSVRTGRTTWAYTYTLRVQVDSQSYTGGSFTVTSSNPATKVTQGAVALGALDAGTFIHTTSTFTIQQDRTVAFNPSALSFAFSGTVSGIATGTGAVQIGPVDFLEEGGRPGHAGMFPIQGNNPDAGITLALHAKIFGGPTNPAFSFVDATTGATVLTGPLTQPDSTTPYPDYFASVIVPSTPFKIAITATNANAATVQWTSATTYRPRSYTLRLAPSASILALGQTTAATIKITSATASGAYTFALLLPAGLTGATGPWTVTLAPGYSANIPTTITATTALTDYAFYTLSVVGTSVSNPADVQYANVRFSVE
jgi:hypothetical protein